MSHPGALWVEGRAATDEGSHGSSQESRQGPIQVSGRAVVALTAAAIAGVVAVDLALTGRVSMFFDLWFVLICLGMALLVRRRDFFTVGVLPPLAMAGAFAIVAMARPEAIATADDGIVQAVVSGLAHHSVALFCGYALCLVTLFARQRATS